MTTPTKKATKTPRKKAVRKRPTKVKEQAKALVAETKSMFSDKTYRDLLSELPSPVRERAIANCDKLDEYPPRYFTEARYVLYSAFDWVSSKEGMDYWSSIASGCTPPEPQTPKKPWWKFW